MIRGEIELYRPLMKNIRLLDKYYFTEELTAEIVRPVDRNDYRRYHQSLKIVTPAEVCNGRAAAILEQRERTKRETANRRKTEYRKAIAVRKSVS